MKSCKSQERNESKNTRLLVFVFSSINLAFWCLVFGVSMWFGRFQILICEPQSIWRKLLVLSWLYLLYSDQSFIVATTVCNINYDLYICWQIVPPFIALLAAILSKWSCMIEGYIQKLMESAQYLAHVRHIHSWAKRINVVPIQNNMLNYFCFICFPQYLKGQFYVEEAPLLWFCCCVIPGRQVCQLLHKEQILEQALKPDPSQEDKKNLYYYLILRVLKFPERISYEMPSLGIWCVSEK